MKAEHRLLRTKDGFVHFARVGIELEPSEQWAVTWEKLVPEESSHPSNPYFSEAAEEGILVAAREHTRRGGTPYTAAIVRLSESMLDTRADYVLVTAALATWKALGYPEAEANIEILGDEWHLTFLNSPNSTPSPIL